MSTSLDRVLLLDDDAELRALAQRYLLGAGFSVRTVAEASQLDKLLARESFDVLVLDLMMPGEDGLSICRRLRARGENIPIMMLTARGDPIDRIIGLEMGADDYLAKPFEPRELAARLRAMLRRRNMDLQESTLLKQGILHFAQFELDLGKRTLLRKGTPLTLTSGEFALLKALASNPGRALGRERLLELAHGKSAEREQGLTERSIDVQVLRLRRLLEENPSDPQLIQTVWGVGYVFSPAVPEESQA